MDTLKKVAAGIILTNKKLLLVKRGDDSRFFPGYWALPGGKVEPNESLEEAASREVKEEVGLEFKATQEYHVSERFGFETHRFLGVHSGNIKIQEDELSGYCWAKYEEAKNLPLAFDLLKEIIEKLHEENRF